jgi:zinc protease
MKRSSVITALFALGLLTSCGIGGGTFTVDFEKFTLENGLEVVFHIDRSDPVVAVAMTYHVGSARELPGKTGFAHLFEHLLFLESENLGKGGLDILINKVGGTLNGSTSQDRTNYYQVVPSDALEKILWAEADKMGFFINTVTEPVVEKEKQVVKNEKRQGVDNQPYGHNSYVIDSNLYPAGHPYSWQVIGSLEDLQSATLQDVRDFYRTWYVPNNATLVVAGDFDVEQARVWVEKYFGEIASGELGPDPEPTPAVLAENRLLFHEDNFARLPTLTVAWPTVEQYHPDSYPLAVLASLLADGKKAPFYKVLVEERKVTPNVSLFSQSGEVAGRMTLSVRSFPDVDLDNVYAAVEEAFARFEQEGFTEADLERVKAGEETSFYSVLSSVLGKGFLLAQYNIFAGDPGYVSEDIQRILDVTPQDVMRVYEQFIKDHHFVATSFVPRGQADLTLAGSTRAAVVEEQIVAGAEEEFVLGESGPIEKTPSAFDRTVEPPFGATPEVTIPEIWTERLENGMRVYGVQNNEMPLVQFNLSLKGGLLLDDPEKIGVANLVGALMNEGTASKTPQELEEAIDQLGASIRIRAGRESITVSGNTLARNYDRTMELVEEMLLEPRWDQTEFDLARQRTLNAIRQMSASPNSISANAYNSLLYGSDHILSNPIQGTLESVETITLDDLKDFYQRTFSPTIAVMHVVGDVGRDRVMASLGGLNTSWESRDVEMQQYSLPDPVDRSRIYFVDVPGAKQSVIRVGYLALARTDDDYYPATVMNYRLGGGGFASQILQVLREEKGYTYGAGSSFAGSEIPGPFSVSTSVRTNITFESVSIIKEILENYGAGFNETDLAATQGYLLKSNARAFETLGAKLNMLQQISTYGLPYDYVLQREAIVRDMTVDRIKELAAEYVRPDRMVYLVVGDARTQLARLRGIGFGRPVLIDREGRPTDR